MANTKVNIPLLKRLRTRFLRMRHRKHFDMRTWADKNECGTSACIAGHTLLLAGYKLRRVVDEDDFEFVSPRGRVVDPPTAARRELGLSKSVTGSEWSCGQRELFYDGSIRTPKQAAARIQELIEKEEKR